MSKADAAAGAKAQTALSAEHATLWAYGVLGPRAGDDKSLATASFDAHREARDDLIAWLTAAHQRPVAAQPGYRLPFHLGASADAAALARRLEDGCGNAYAALVAFATDNALRRLAVTQLIDCAARRVNWGGTPMRFPGLPGGS